jgi:hypothetical protein
MFLEFNPGNLRCELAYATHISRAEYKICDSHKGEYYGYGRQKHDDTWVNTGEAGSSQSSLFRFCGQNLRIL